MLCLAQELRAHHPGIGDVRGRGLMIGLSWWIPERALPAEAGDPPRLRRPTRPSPSPSSRNALRRGLTVELGGRHGAVVRLLPPLTLTDEQATAVVDRLADALAAATRSRTVGPPPGRPPDPKIPTRKNAVNPTPASEADGPGTPSTEGRTDRPPPARSRRRPCPARKPRTTPAPPRTRTAGTSRPGARASTRSTTRTAAGRRRGGHRKLCCAAGPGRTTLPLAPTATPCASPSPAAAPRCSSPCTTGPPPGLHRFGAPALENAPPRPRPPTPPPSPSSSAVRAARAARAISSPGPPTPYATPPASSSSGGAAGRLPPRRTSSSPPSSPCSSATLHPTPKSREGLSESESRRYSPELHGSFPLHWFAVDRSLAATDSALDRRRPGHRRGTAGPHTEGLKTPPGTVAVPVHPGRPPT